jgi:hypothetical protein
VFGFDNDILVGFVGDAMDAEEDGLSVDAETCAQMSAGEPTIGLAALAELRSFLDSRFRDRPNDDGIAGAQPSVRAVQSKVVARFPSPGQD